MYRNYCLCICVSTSLTLSLSFVSIVARLVEAAEDPRYAEHPGLPHIRKSVQRLVAFLWNELVPRDRVPAVRLALAQAGDLFDAWQLHND